MRLAGALHSHGAKALFVREVSHPYDPAPEYRFEGVLGLGGKFQNERCSGALLHVSCYEEFRTEVPGMVVERTNDALQELFLSEDSS